VNTVQFPSIILHPFSGASSQLFQILTPLWITTGRFRSPDPPLALRLSVLMPSPRRLPITYHRYSSRHLDPRLSLSSFKFQVSLPGRCFASVTAGFRFQVSRFIPPRLPSHFRTFNFLLISPFTFIFQASSFRFFPISLSPCFLT
jgi:hypothetical protein